MQLQDFTLKELGIFLNDEPAFEGIHIIETGHSKTILNGSK